MRKTIIALTLASAFAAPAMANEYFAVDTGDGWIVVDKNPSESGRPGNVVGHIEGNDLFHEGNRVGSIEKEFEGKEGNYFKVSGEKGEGTVYVDKDGKIRITQKPVGPKPLPGVDETQPDNGNGWVDGDKETDAESGATVTPGKEQPLPDGGTLLDDAVSHANAAYQEGAVAYANIDGRVSELEVNFDNFKAETDRKFKEMDQRLDATNASLHAVTNARPMVSNGQTAFGVGTGFAGSAQAIAVGVAHSFEDSGWSASASINQTTGGYSEFNGGAGVQYAF